MEEAKKVILFGAGTYGRKALAYFGRENVHCFADNNRALSGTLRDGVPVISFERLREIHGPYRIVISTGTEMLFVIGAQLEEAGIYDYEIFLKIVADHLPPAPRASRSGCGKCRAEWEGASRAALMIAYYFPPLSGSGVFRSIKFARYLPRFGWRPTVISAERPPLEMNYRDENLLGEIPEGTEIIRIPDEIGTMEKASFSGGEERELLLLLKSALQDSREGQRLLDGLAETKMGRASLLTFPCAALLWSRRVLQYIEEHVDLSKFRAVYTTAGPYSAHLIGFCLKRKYGVPWVADYRDPWTGNPYKNYCAENPQHRLLFELESALLRCADCNLTISEGFVESYVTRFGLPRENIKSITNGYDERDFTPLRFSEEQPDKFTITYSGILYSENRSILPIFKAIRELSEEGELELEHVRLRIIGRESDACGLEMADAYGLGAVVEQAGYVSHQEALQANYDSNMLLLLVGDSEKNKATYTGKFFDYLRSGRPILALASLDGAVAQALRETGHGEARLSTDLAGIKAMILKEYGKWRRGEKRSRLHSPLIARFERSRLTGQLAEILESVSR